MATFLQPTIDKGSDMVHDFLCSTCKDKKLDESAEYYCESCVKFFCGKCIDLRGQLYTKHSPHGRGDMKNWPVAKKVEDFLLKCDVHKEENNDMFCKDHGQLCCNKCVFMNHRTCTTVMLLSALLKNTSIDLKQVSVTIQTTLAKLKELQDNQEASIRSVQSSYDEQLHKIQETRKNIIAALNKLEKKTLREMKDTLIKLQAPLNSDIDKCATLRGELKQLGDAIHNISDKSKQELSLIASIKCQVKIQQFEKYQKENFVEVKSSIIFQPNFEIVQYLSKLSELGRIEHSIQTFGKSEYDVHLGDSNDSKCSIRDICVLPDGHVLIADLGNSKIKLLKQQYQLVSNCRLSGQPWGMSVITPTEVGVTVGSKVKFIKVNNCQLVKVRNLKLQHECIGIAYDEGDLFVPSGTARFKYTLSGKLVSKLHEDKSDKYTVLRCAVSPTGGKLYITNRSQHKLLTLARDGSVLAIFMDPELQWPTNVLGD
ncbi:uncharacterized protein LOC127846517 [Dreissena polymorpha]|uniref:B box-type domain-containing protein n=1 Tax=Dreissena polymorpha TaxID=45954 RepID=A0A9D4DZ28_DREPO|nr:uncharacterized protein LOC127846517 [Dreissena polymorpha]KAH3768989.1 hypothetical protein DPMN_170233 [Dreissena polymorpha]